jgi:hypothetical protein
MTVRVYVSRDASGKPRPPEHSHEVEGSLDVLKRIWRAFSNEEALYAVAANLRVTSADMIVLSQLGLGVIEFKHVPGRIVWRGNTWYADSKPIEAGADDFRGYSHYENPHRQVQAYACKIRDQLLKPGLISWLPGSAQEWNRLKIHTAVCFTNPGADVTELRETISRQHTELLPWEKFDVVPPVGMPEWVVKLRFDIEQGKARNHELYRLTTKQIVNIAELMLLMTEWTEIVSLMPTGEPYGYLGLLENGVYTQVYWLDREEVMLGRDPYACAVLLPQYFARVSRQHAQIRFTVDGVVLEDKDSTNGTYVDGLQLTKPRILKPRQRITLGGPAANEKVCALVFSREPIRQFVPDATERM